MFWLWLLLYGLLFAVPRALAPAAAPLLTPALLAVYWAVLLRGLHTRGRLRSYGLCRARLAGGCPRAIPETAAYSFANAAALCEILRGCP